MADDPDAQLAAAVSASRELARARTAHGTLIGQLHALDADIAALRDQLAGEENDVERLEGLSLTSVVAALRQSRLDDLAVQRAERDAVRYRVAETENRRRLLTRELDRVDAIVAAHAAAEADLAAALADKERRLAESNDPKASELSALSEARAGVAADRTEVDEAISAAVDADRSLAELADRLERARNWSTYDTWLGGGAIGSMVKQSRLDEAQDAASHAQVRLGSLRAELADVSAVQTDVPDLSIDGLTRFVDVWFDNIFTDYAIGQRISDGQQAATRARQGLKEILEGLFRRQAQLEERLAEVEARRRELLTA